MKLFSLPYLAYSRIITSMNPIEVISLSFCSKKSRERIKQIHFHVDYAGISTKVNKFKAPVFQLRISTGGRHLSIPFQTAPRPARCEGRRFTWTIDGVKHYFRCGESQLGSIIYSNIPKSYFKITNNILDLVRASLSILELDLNVINDLKGFITEPCMKSVSGIKVVSETITAEKLSIFFNNIENPVKDVFIYSKVEGEVSTSLNIFRSDRLIAFKADWVTRENILGFNGKFLCLFNPTIDIGTIIEFIKQWRNGNNTKFVALKMAKVPQELMKIDQFISEFNAKPWDPTKREKCYIYEKEITDKQNIVADLSEGFDFERHDGLLATIKIRPPDFFQFFVWHKRFTAENRT
ncbi:hypothetical protein CRE_08030 [Caenorhabditis remanei]|uniref:F-box domain-containing protein n=1 Tax=Caenorhabditis remanei TaxID=31234 RepID=E3M3W7_CAERE|nr:hypothetical protein CRE_08030 [Caenorhabditis remanei]